MISTELSAESTPHLGWRTYGSLDLLADREDELRRLRELLPDQSTGRGVVAAVVGGLGTGRSAFLRRTVELATDRGIRTVVARGSREESTLRYGVVQQLLSSLGPGDRSLAAFRDRASRATRQDDAALIADVTRVFLRSAREAPLVVVIDDVQWLDPQSCRWLHVLVRRLREAPVLVVIATTPDLALGAPRAPDSAMPHDGLLAREARVVRLRPLSAAGVRAVLERAYRGPIDDAFVAGMTHATQGNPALLHAVLGHFHRDQLTPSAANAAELEELAAEAAGDLIAPLLEGMPAGYLALLRAIAVADGLLPTDLVCRLAGLPPIPAPRALEFLRAGGLLLDDEPPTLAHSAAARRILEGLSAQQRKVLHAEAAELAYRSGLADERIARLLLGAHQMNARWVVSSLRGASAACIGVDDAAAVEFLRRALHEPLDDEERAQVLVELGAVEVLGDHVASDFHLSKAMLGSGSDEVLPYRLRAADLMLARGSLVSVHRLTAEVCARLAKAGRESPPLLALHWFADLAQPQRGNRLVGLPPVPPVSETPTEPAQAAFAAWRLTTRGTAVEGARELARSALRHRRSGERLFYPEIMASRVLTLTDDVDEAFAGLGRVLLEARHRRLPTIVARALVERVALCLWSGRLPAAESELACLAEEFSQRSWQRAMGAPFVAYEALVRLELDEIDRAEQVLHDAFRAGGADCVMWPLLVFARGAVRLATDDASAAISDLEECGRGLRERRTHNATLVPWRRLSTVARRACGDSEGAAELAAEHLAQARQWGTASAVGEALLTSAGIADGARAERLLADAVQMLENAPSRTLHASALTKLAAARMANGDAAAAVSLLRQAFKITEFHGARRLRRQVTENATALGIASIAFPLTSLEDRAIELAGRGMPDLLIAVELSIARGDVDELLVNVYRKLGVHVRDPLLAAVGDGV